MNSPILYLQTEAAKNLLKSLDGTLSDGWYENGPFYFSPKEDGKRKVKPCDESYHPACPEGFTPSDISGIEVRVNEDYRLFGLWSKDKDADLRRYGILDFMDLLVWDRSEGRDKDGCRRRGSLWMVGVIIATENQKLGIDVEEVSSSVYDTLEGSQIHGIYAKDVKHWDLKLMDTLREINEALRTSNSFSKDPEYGRLTHWKRYLSAGDCRWCNPWQRSYDQWSMMGTDVYEDWMLESPYIEER